MPVEYKSFPDGESYLRVEDVQGEVVIIQSIVNDRDFVSLLQLVDACQSRADSVRVVIPYLGYARQDREFKMGEPVTVRAIARTIDVDRVFTVNVHNPESLEYFPCPARDLEAAPLLGEYFKKLGLSEPVVVSPDRGAVEMAARAAEAMDADYDYLEKTRHSGEEVTVKPKELEVKGRDVVILDDIISTGGTIAGAARILQGQGARRVFVGCVHPVLARNALIRLFNAGIADIVASDTIERGVSRVTVSPLLARALES